MKKLSKKQWLYIGGAIALVIVLFLVFRKKKGSDSTLQKINPDQGGWMSFGNWADAVPEEAELPDFNEYAGKGAFVYKGHRWSSNIVSSGFAGDYYADLNYLGKN